MDGRKISLAWSGMTTIYLDSEEASHTVNLLPVVVLLGAAVIAVPLFKKIGLGSVLGYLAAGLAIGPFGLKLVTDSASIIPIAELGVVMFLFIIGLEMKPSHLWSLRRQIFGLGTLQIFLSGALMTAVSMLLGISWQVAFICASGVMLTSTAIVMQVLAERSEVNTPAGQKIVSVLLFEDLLIVPLLAVVALLAPTTAATEHTTPLWQQLGLGVLVLVILVGIGLFLLNPLFKILARTRASEVMTAAALFVVLGAAWLMDFGGLSMAMGAFIAGVLLSESSFRHQLEADIEPFRGLLLGLFFLGVGMSLDLAVVAGNWRLILLGTAALMTTKGSCVYFVGRLTKSSHREALERAVLMAQGGEFAFVLFATASSAGVINAEVNANMTATIVISMGLTPLLLIIQNRFYPVGVEKQEEEHEADVVDEHYPVILLGMGRFGVTVNNMLRMTGHGVTIIDKDPSKIEGFDGFGVKAYFGDATRPEILQAAGINEAALLVIAIDDYDDVNQIIEFAKRSNPDIKIIAQAKNRLQAYQLYQEGADGIITETFDAAVRSGVIALKLLGLEKGLAEEIGSVYYRGNERMLPITGPLYDPELSVFENERLQAAYAEEMAKTQECISRLMRGGLVTSDEKI